MSKESSNTSNGMGCTGALSVGLTILFVGLKLTNNIDWSWWWVLSPLWIYAALSLLLLVVIVVLAIAIAATK